MAKKEDEEMMNRGGEDEPEVTGTEPPVGASDAAAPRAARFGEGREGAGARRERGVEGPRQGFLGRAGQFIHDVRVELRRVSWPGAIEVRNTTIITIIAVIFFAVYLWVVDKGFTLLISQSQRLLGAA